MSTEAGLWALVALLTVLVVILLALLLRAHRSNESAAKPQPDSQRATTAGATALGPEKVSTPPTVDADGLRRRNAGAEALTSPPVEKEVVPVVTSAAGPRSPSRLQPPRQEAGPSQEADLSEDGTTRYQASLERSGTAAWGFAWNVAALAMKRLILAGVDPASPAGAWNTKRKEDGCQPMQRGDEVVAVNEITTYSEMRKELALPALQVNLRLVVDAASAETSPNREALRRRREAGCSKASSASGLGSNESSPMLPKSPAREDSKPRSPLPLGSDHVKVKNTFIEFSDETPREEEQSPVRFTQSDPTPVLEAMRNTTTTTTTTTTCTLDSSQRMEPPPVTPSSQRSQEPLEASQTSASPGRRKPTPLSDDSEVSENPGALPSSSPKTEEVDLNTSWIPETPEAFGFGGHPLLLEHLLPEAPMDQEVSSQPIQSMVEMPIPMPSSPPLAFQPALQVGPPLHPVLTAAPAPVLQYAPPMGQRPTSAPQEASERLSPEIRHPRWTSQTLPLPPGALPPGPVANPSEASPSDASAHHEVSPGDSEESETEVTSPESKRKPTRRGGRRARHRKMAALARQQAAAEAAEEVEMDLPHADPHAAPRAYSPAEVKPRSTSSPSEGSMAIPAPSGVRLSSEDGAQLIGRMVLIQGLVRSPEFNGQWGHVESYDPQMQRFMVSVVLPTQLPGETPLYAKLRRDNLILPRRIKRHQDQGQEMQPPLGSPVPMPPREVHWPAEPAFIQEHIVSPLSAMVQATPPGPAADFEDSVGAALMTPGCRIQPGASLEDSGSPPQRSSQDSYASKPSMSLGTSPDMLSPEVRQMWLNQGTAADFEDSMVGQLFDSPKAASRGGNSPSSKLKRFGGGFSYAEGTPADFEDSIGGTTGWPDFVKEESSSANTGPSWQPSLRPKGHDV